MIFQLRRAKYDREDGGRSWGGCVRERWWGGGRKKLSHVGRRKGETAERFLRCVFGPYAAFILAEVR